MKKANFHEVARKATSSEMIEAHKQESIKHYKSLCKKQYRDRANREEILETLCRYNYNGRLLFL